jgi:5'-3' exonuclease
MIQIFLKTLTGKTLTIDLESNDNIQIIKEKINDLCGVPVEYQNIYFSGHFLNNDTATLHDQGITNESCLELCLSLKGAGIPTYFKNIIKKHSDAIIKSTNVQNNYFFIDFNAMIYDTIKLMKPIETDTLAFYENKIIVETIKYIDLVIGHVNPDKLTYICMDGVPPMAKIKQQRARRFRGLLLDSYKMSIYKKFKKEQTLKIKNWSTSCISPGTIFMNKLSSSVRTHYKNNNKIIFNDYNTCGEGEHKILHFIKDKLETDSKSSVVIYSPDADLIVLCLSTNKNKIYLLRNNDDPELAVEHNEKEYVYLDIDLCREHFYKETENLLDYSFLTFFCGNDFVVPSLFLKIKDNGLDLMINSYNDVCKELENDTLINDNNYTINYTFFKQLIGKLKEIELYKLRGKQVHMNIVRKKPIEMVPPETTVDEQIELLLKNFQHLDYYNPNHPLFNNFNKVFNCINYFEDDWIYKYNKFFFNDHNIEDVCKEYIKSFIFCLKYYYTKDIDWLYYYKYRASPTFHDLYEFLEKTSEEEFNKLTIDYTNKPVNIYEQLLIILPKEQLHLMPNNFRNLDKYSIDTTGGSYYPEKFFLDIMHGHKYIYSEPVLPDIDLQLVRDYVSQFHPRTS